MDEYRTLQLKNIYSERDVTSAFSILNDAGIETQIDDQEIILNFDAVDVKYLEKSKSDNLLLSNVVGELLKIRSFSTSNGKTVFKSFNKEKKVTGKDENKKKRLGYEYYKKVTDKKIRNIA